jgi:hypothetical protein
MQAGSQQRQQSNLKDLKALANTEVIRIIKHEAVLKSNSAHLQGGFAMANEQGDDLKRVTLDYIERFNEFEVDD